MIKTEIDLQPLLPLDRISAALVAQTASHFESRLTLECESMVLNLKSMLGLLSHPFLEEGRAILVAEGEDEKKAVESILAIFQKK